MTNETTTEKPLSKTAHKKLQTETVKANMAARDEARAERAEREKAGLAPAEREAFSDQRLTGWRPAARGLLPILPPEASLPATLKKLKANVDGHLVSEKKTRVELQAVTGGRLKLERRYQAEIAEAARAGNELPENPIPGHEALLVDLGHRAKGLRKAAEIATLDFGREAIAVRDEQLSKQQDKRTIERAKLRKMLLDIEKQMVKVQASDSIVTFWENVASARPGFRQVPRLAAVKEMLVSARDGLGR